ncbi:MAG TPA: CPBP family intramembrane glutamic endopeptidase [Vicinamibacterales bacterium]|nr:CPBP family intramembrane glutamic endopeptidase [Vicinamibacterales bacterium]
MTPLVDQVHWVTLLGWYHVFIFAVVVPLLALRGRQKLAQAEAPAINRLKHFRATSVMLILFGSLSLLTAENHHLSLFHGDVRRILFSLPVGAALCALAVLLMRPRWRKAVAQRKRVVQLFMPQTPAERNWWLAVSVLAGISEEITWRGVQSTLLAAMVGSPWLAVLLCAVMFGAAHLTQGWKSAGIIVLFGLGFQALVWVSGSLYVPMIVHAAYDIIAGLTYGKWGREFDPSPILSLWPTRTTS